MKQYIIRFKEPAENSLAGWVNRSFPIGNGYFGVNVFGGQSEERLSLSEQSLIAVGGRFVNERYAIGNECFSFLHIDTAHNNALCENYERTLCMNTGIAKVSYDFDGVHYTREYFASYTDKVLVVRLSCDRDGALEFRVRPRIAYERDHLIFPGDGRGKSGKVIRLDDCTIENDGFLQSYDMKMHMFTRVRTEDGSVAVEDYHGIPALNVRGATSAEIIVTLGTDYDMNKVIFGLPADCVSEDEEIAEAMKNPALRMKHCPDKRDEYLARLNAATGFAYDELKQRHLLDFEEKFNRVAVDFGGADNGETTDALLLDYKTGKKSIYLEELHFQMGRYMLLSSSRDGGLPANLQGIWNMFNFAPWTCGFWYNINIQMNYWPAFVCNLKECFDAYHNFNNARFEGCSRLADKYIHKLHPAQYTDAIGKNGWIVGTGNSAMHIGDVGGHSGPGTGGLTTKAYWDYYDFTRDLQVLKNDAYPYLEAVARFYTKCVEWIDDKYLVTHSSSPEQKIDGTPYVTTGCGFDQQMLHESISDYIKASDLLGLDSGLIDLQLYETAKAQFGLYDPIQVGASGQIKEYREENYYGEYGELEHRHISQLCGAFPGTLLQRENPAWSDAAKQTVLLRGLDSGKGWSKAHKMLVLARNGGADEALYMAESVLRENVFDNLWNDHCGVAVFQADANFGMSAAYAELLLQSHAGYIDVLPQVPTKWSSGRFDGLCARGNFVVGADWENGEVREIRIRSVVGTDCCVRCADLSQVQITNANGKQIPYTINADGKCTFATEAGERYAISGIRNANVCPKVEKLSASVEGSAVQLSWGSPCKDAVYAVYKAEGSAPEYTLLCNNLTEAVFNDTLQSSRATYKVTAKTDVLCESEGVVSFVTVTE